MGGGHDHKAKPVPTDVAEDTPGVNGMVAQPYPAPVAPALPFGHVISDFFAGRADPFTSMMHPEVVQDRMLAEQQLAGRFDIISDKHKGKRLPNQVTRAEYQQLVNTYSDIRMGRGDLTLDHAKDPDKAQYETDKMDDIADILQTKSGRELVEKLSNNTHGVDANGNPIHHHTTLEPLYDHSGHLVDTTSYSEADSNQDSELRPDGTAGPGTNVRVQSNANMDNVDRDRMTQDVTGGRTRSDVVLFHELVHALHQTDGTVPTDFVGQHEKTYADPYLEEDKDTANAEYQAIGLGRFANNRLTENAYRAERHGVAASGKGIAGDQLMDKRLGSITVPSYQTIGGK